MTDLQKMEFPPLPEAFCERIASQFRGEHLAFLKSLNKDSRTSVRINSNKSNAQPEEEKIPWAQNAYFLSQRPSFVCDPLFHAGHYYVQEASSMFLEQAILQLELDKKAITALDLCAAPGGKSTHLIQLINNDSLLVSNEVIRSRAPILAENLIKWGKPNYVVTSNDASHFQQLQFDLIVVDAPCSGEGLFRKQAESRNEWSQNNCDLCSARQQRILEDIWPALAPDGILVYSTCTYNPRENELGLEQFLSDKNAQIKSLQLSNDWNVNTVKLLDGEAYRFLPHQSQGEGFFMAVIQKQESQVRKPISNKHSKKSSKQQIAAYKGNALPYALKTNFLAYQKNKIVFACNPLHTKQLFELDSQLYILQFGGELGLWKGKDFIPSHALAQNIVFDSASVPRYKTTRAEAQAYLRKENLTMPDTAKAYVLVEYENAILGWAKNIGNRSNNLYPMHYRVRKVCEE